MPRFLNILLRNKKYVYIALMTAGLILIPMPFQKSEAQIFDVCFSAYPDPGPLFHACVPPPTSEPDICGLFPGSCIDVGLIIINNDTRSVRVWEEGSYAGREVCFKKMGVQNTFIMSAYTLTNDDSSDGTWWHDPHSYRLEDADKCTNPGITTGTEIEEWCEGCGWLPHQWPKCIECMYDYIVTLPIRLALAGMTALFGVFTIVANWIYVAVSSVAIAAIQVFLKIGITPGLCRSMGATVPSDMVATPEIICIGWTFTRDFVNMIFLLILAAIGFATILRVETWAAKKTLPILILMALLVNFSGVLVGFFVDMGNILTMFFIEKAGGAQAPDMSKFVWEGVWDILTKPIEGEDAVTEFTAIMAQAMIGGIFFFVAILVYLALLFIFFLRVVVLWLITISAPIVFAMAVLPSTRKYWDDWWRQLIQWSLVGIPIGFCLYLSTWMLNNWWQGAQTSASPFYEIEQAAGSNIIAAMLAGFLAPFAALIILGGGIMLSVQFAPSASGYVVGFFRSTGRRALGYGKAMGASGLRYARRTVRERPIVTKTEDVMIKRMERLPVLRGLAKNLEAGRTKRKEEVKGMITFVERQRGAAGVRDRMSAITSGTPERQAAFERLVEKGEVTRDDISWATGRRSGITIDKDLRKRVLLVRPDFAPAFGEDVQATIAKQTPGEFRRSVNTDALKNLDVFYATHYEQVSDVMKRGTQQQKEALRDTWLQNQKTIDEAVKKAEQEGRKEFADRQRRKALAIKAHFPSIGPGSSDQTGQPGRRPPYVI